MHGTELILSPRQGPAKPLLGLAQGELWVGDSRVAPCAVAKWASCPNLPLVGGNVLVVQCGSLIPIDSSNIKTYTFEKMRI